jgi:hypothetical protein
MTWKQVRTEALRIVDGVAQRKSDLELTEYQNKVRYRADHPAGMTMRITTQSSARPCARPFVAASTASEVW